VYYSKEGHEAGIGLSTRGSAAHTDTMKASALAQALAAGKYDVVFGGARRDEEKSRARERIFSFRDEHQQWDAVDQRPRLCSLYNPKIKPGESIRVFPIGN
jgi:sulfate adenylyltransferase subunit 2